jgi:Flp pilus assembly pilin Flp
MVPWLLVTPLSDDVAPRQFSRNIGRPRRRLTLVGPATVILLGGALRGVSARTPCSTGDGMRSVLRSRGERESGAAAIEFALLLPIFAALTFGIITFGVAFERWLSVTAAAREASRFAATYPLQDGQSAAEWADQVLDVATRAAGLEPEDLPDPDEFGICVSFSNAVGPGTLDSVGPDATQRWTLGNLNPTGEPDEACISLDVPDNRVAVTVSRDADLNWFFFSTSTVVSGRNTSRFEPSLG